MNNLSNRSVPFSDWIRQRRLELRRKQADLAAELHVTDEAVGHWESGRRRPELNKIPRLAAALKVSSRDLCRKALDEWYPAFYDGLFTDRPQSMRHLEPARPKQDSGLKLLAPATADGSALEAGVIVGDGLREREQLAE
jgi:transcriptional regulator with XRE-family HTH domain